MTVAWGREYRDARTPPVAGFPAQAGGCRRTGHVQPRRPYTLFSAVCRNDSYAPLQCSLRRRVMAASCACATSYFLLCYLHVEAVLLTYCQRTARADLFVADPVRATPTGRPR